MNSSISVSLFKNMVINGAINLKNNHQEIDQLNVFPVPDGDTGTNMSMTVMSGIRELSNCESSSIIDCAKVLSRGALMGARGNSGVILSQFFRGFFVGLKEIKNNYLEVSDFIACLESGYKIAYKAVMEPVEGTILTVVREACQNMMLKKDTLSTIEEVLDCYIEEAKKSLANTPNLLPVLKEAGVVDSGAAGFIKIVEGWRLALDGTILTLEEAKKEEKASKTSELKHEYCVEFVCNLTNNDFQVKELNASLSIVGEDVELIVDDKLVGHIHTNRPGRVLDLVMKHGSLESVKVENLNISHTDMANGVAFKKSKPKKHFALISVCFGEGIVKAFKELGVDYVIEGGQTMNPSTESFVEAIKAVNAENIIIIPNNGNVIMAAKQAASMVSDCKVEVLKAKTIAAGYASLMVYNEAASIEENLEAMLEAVGNVVAGEITYSIRDTEIGGVKINAGDFMGIKNDKIIVSTKEKSECLKTLLENSICEESQIVTFFCGNDLTQEEIDGLTDLVLEINEEVEVEIIEGKQDIYSYIIAVE